MDKKIQGWINLYKPVGISSFSAINKIKKKFNIYKIGHAGTLDPNAEGILPIAINKATKLIPFINSNLKKYFFAIQWGIETTTDDSEGKVLNICNKVPKVNEIKKILNLYLGYTDQIPPKASAVKVNGRRAYSILRDEKNFTLKPKKYF